MDLITFNEEILNGKLHFLCSATDRNPGNIGIRGCSVHKTPTEYCRGRSWPQYQQNWPPDINTELTVETENEAKNIQGFYGLSVESNHQNEKISKKFSLWKALRIKCWIRRFIVNSTKSSNERIRGLLRSII